MTYFLMSFLLICILMFLFMMSSKKEIWNKDSSMAFECGFSAYFFSRFSFSIHYFVIGLIFLFLDLEMCFIFPFFNQDFSSFFLHSYCWLIILILLLGLIGEWGWGKLEWKF